MTNGNCSHRPAAAPVEENPAGEPVDDYSSVSHTILSECRTALENIDPRQAAALLDAIEQSDQVFFVGVGRVMLALQCMAKRMAHIGVRAHMVGETTEPPIAEGDLLIVGSGSGESLYPVAIARKAKALGARIAWIGCDQESTIAKLSDCAVRIPVSSKRSPGGALKSQQPMTSLFEQSLLLFGDALAMMLIQRKGIQGDLYLRHANLE